jgi:hypothetical protein
MNRYKPNGTPLSDYERELLVILMEECAEVTQAASKLLRFGKENHPDSGLSNSLVLATEVGDLEAIMSMIEEAHLVDRETVGNAAMQKRVRLAHFMQTDRLLPSEKQTEQS